MKDSSFQEYFNWGINLNLNFAIDFTISNGNHFRPSECSLHAFLIEINEKVYNLDDNLYTLIMK